MPYILEYCEKKVYNKMKYNSSTITFERIRRFSAAGQK